MVKWNRGVHTGELLEDSPELGDVRGGDGDKLLDGGRGHGGGGLRPPAARLLWQAALGPVVGGVRQAVLDHPWANHTQAGVGYANQRRRRRSVFDAYDSFFIPLFYDFVFLVFGDLNIQN